MQKVAVTIYQRRDGAYIVVPRGTALHALPAAATHPFMGADCTEKLRDITPGQELLGLDVRAALKDLSNAGFHVAEPFIYESDEP
jgi:hypothetical protein